MVQLNVANKSVYSSSGLNLSGKAKTLSEVFLFVDVLVNRVNRCCGR